MTNTKPLSHRTGGRLESPEEVVYDAAAEVSRSPNVHGRRHGLTIADAHLEANAVAFAGGKEVVDDFKTWLDFFVGRGDVRKKVIVSASF